MNYKLCLEEAHIVSVPRFSADIFHFYRTGYKIIASNDSNIQLRKDATVTIIDCNNSKKYRVTSPTNSLTKSDLTFLECKLKEKEITIDDLLNGKVRNYSCCII